MAAPPPGGPAAAALRDLLATIPDEQKRLEGMLLLDRLIHEERTCGSRLIQMAHVYPGMGMPSMQNATMNTPGAPGMGSWVGVEPLLQEQGVLDPWVRQYPGEETSFPSLATMTGCVQMSPAWPASTWDANGARGVGLQHAYIPNNGGDNRDTSGKNNLGWPDMAKDLELEDDGGPLGSALTESRFLSFVLPPDEAGEAKGGRGSTSTSAIPTMLSSMNAQGKSGGGGDNTALGSQASKSGLQPSGPKFSTVVSSTTCAQLPPGTAGGGSGNDAWNAAAGQPLAAGSQAVAPCSNGVLVTAPIGAQSGSRVGAPGPPAAMLGSGAARIGPMQMPERKSSPKALPVLSSSPPALDKMSAVAGMGVLAAKGSSAAPTAAAIVANGVAAGERADKATVLKKAEGMAAGAAAASAVSGSPGAGTGQGSGAMGRGWETPNTSMPNSATAAAVAAAPARVVTSDVAKSTATVKLRGLPFSATVHEVLGFFRGFNPMDNSVRFGSNQDGRPSGEAWVSFTKVEDAKKAVREKDRHHLGNRYVELFLLNEGGAVASRGR